MQPPGGSERKQTAAVAGVTVPGSDEGPAADSVQDGCLSSAQLGKFLLTPSLMSCPTY